MTWGLGGMGQRDLGLRGQETGFESLAHFDHKKWIPFITLPWGDMEPWGHGTTGLGTEGGKKLILSTLTTRKTCKILQVTRAIHSIDSIGKVTWKRYFKSSIKIVLVVVRNRIDNVHICTLRASLVVSKASLRLLKTYLICSRVASRKTWNLLG